ncbi:MAG: hypothetical protein AAF849_03095 [Bacteroidota bacterium]
MKRIAVKIGVYIKRIFRWISCCVSFVHRGRDEEFIKKMDVSYLELSI